MQKVKVADWNALEDRQPAYALVANVDLVVVRFDDDAAQRADTSALRGGNDEVVPGKIKLGARQAKDLHGNPELEGAEAVVSDRGNPSRPQSGAFRHLARFYHTLSISPLGD